MDAHEFTMFKIAFVVTMAATIASHPSQMSHLRLPAPVWRSCPTAWCNCGGVITAFSGGAGSVRRPWLAG